MAGGKGRELKGKGEYNSGMTKNLLSLNEMQIVSREDQLTSTALLLIVMLAM